MWKIGGLPTEKASLSMDFQEAKDVINELAVSSFILL